MLKFSDEIAARFANLTLRVDDGTTRSLLASVSGQTVSAKVPVPVAGQGREMQSWVLGYRVVSADGHPVQGSIAFRVSNTARTGSRSPAPTGPTTDTSAGPTDKATPPSPGPSTRGADLAGWAPVFGAFGIIAILILAISARRRRRESNS